MMKTFLKGMTALALGLGLASGAQAAEYPIHEPIEQSWSFAGPFGTYNKGQLQRGFQVYREACAACHGLDRVAFRNLEALGYSEQQVIALAAEYEVEDGPDSFGDMFFRPAIPADRFPSPFPNPQAAASANNGAVPPDLSLIAKARAAERGFPRFVIDIFTQYEALGADYIYSLLQGYQDEPEGYNLQPGTYYNPYFLSGTALSMPQPFADGMIPYNDGTPETIEQYSRDVAAFLMWTAEPHLETRKQTGFVVMIFLVLFGGLVYMSKRKVWSSVPH